MSFKSGLNYFRALRPACSYEPGLRGSSLEWDSYFCVNMTIFIPPRWDDMM